MNNPYINISFFHFSGWEVKTWRENKTQWARSSSISERKKGFWKYYTKLEERYGRHEEDAWETTWGNRKKRKTNGRTVNQQSKRYWVSFTTIK